MSFSVVTVTAWDGFSGFAEDAYGELHRFEYGEVDPEDVLSLEIGSKLIIPEDGYISLSTSAFCRYIEEEHSVWEEPTGSISGSVLEETQIALISLEEDDDEETQP